MVNAPSWAKQERTKSERPMCVSLSDEEAQDMTLIEVIKIDFNGIIMINSVIAAFVLFLSFSSEKSRAECMGVILTDHLPGGQELQPFYVHSLTSIYTLCRRYFSDWSDVKRMSVTR